MLIMIVMRANQLVGIRMSLLQNEVIHNKDRKFPGFALSFGWANYWLGRPPQGWRTQGRAAQPTHDVAATSPRPSSGPVELTR